MGERIMTGEGRRTQQPTDEVQIWGAARERSVSAAFHLGRKLIKVYDRGSPLLKSLLKKRQILGGFRGGDDVLMVGGKE